MPTKTQYDFVSNNIALVKEPILIIGAKMYDYDLHDFRELLAKHNFKNITGIDIADGKGVDAIVDVTDENASFFEDKKSFFKTIICMSVLMYVKNPFKAASNISSVADKGSALFVSEPFCHAPTSMPADYWRFTVNSIKEIFHEFTFIDEKSFFNHSPFVSIYFFHKFFLSKTCKQQ